MAAPASADGIPQYGERPVLALAARPRAARRAPREFLRDGRESDPAQALSDRSAESGLSTPDRRRAALVQLSWRRRHQRHYRRRPAAPLSIPGIARTPANRIQIIE